MNHPATCIACGGSLTLFGPRLGYEYHCCTQCRTIQLHPLPSKQELSRAYAADYATATHYEGDAELCRMSARPYYQSIVRSLQDHSVTGLVVDYGAGWGGLCEMLVGAGFRTQGIEPSAMMAAHCRANGLPVQQGDLNVLQDMDGQVGAFALCTVFEHLVEHDAWLMRVHQLLRPHGLIITLQPTAPFADFVGKLVRLGDLHKPLPALHQVFCPPWHVAFFSFDGLRQLMTRHGFELLEIRPAPQGRIQGLTGLVQAALGAVNRLGWEMMGRDWPLLIAHTFVFRKT